MLFSPKALSKYSLPTFTGAKEAADPLFQGLGHQSNLCGCGGRGDVQDVALTLYGEKRFHTTMAGKAPLSSYS